ncbi:MAG: hypothetical protein H6636_01815 [Anaerolineales bacterium]|nr:hypothetical protein [Anaerolineales bacterium]
MEWYIAPPLPAPTEDEIQTPTRTCDAPFVEPRPGQPCPACGEGVLDYDGLMQISCPLCGHVTSGGGFT